MIRKLADLGLFLFLILSALMIVVYLLGLYDKVSRPGFKNISDETYFWIGIVLFVVVLIDWFIIKRLFSGKDTGN